MRTIKPLRLSLLTRPFDANGRARLAVTAMVGFGLERPKALQHDVAFWKAVATSVPSGVFDEFMPKTRGELLVFGSAHNIGAPATQRIVRFGVSTGQGKETRTLIAKELLVTGDRVWGLSQPSAAKPFDACPLVPERAFGGEGFADNPVGKGYRPIALAGSEVHPLPNVELRREAISSRGDRPTPALVGALDVMSPERQARRGTYDKAWLETRFPGFPQDFDWEFQNLAPRDQRIDGFFSGRETLSLFGLSPDRETITSELPPVAPRVFIERRAQVGKLEELQLRLDTLVALPGALMGVLVFRAVTDIEQDDAEDIRTIVGGLDDRDELRPVAHFQRIQSIREDKTEFQAELLDDSPLLPPWFIEPPMAAEEWNDVAKHIELSKARFERGQRTADKQTEEAQRALDERMVELGDASSLSEDHQTLLKSALGADFAPGKIPRVDVMGNAPTTLAEVPAALAKAKEELRVAEEEGKRAQVEREQKLAEEVAKMNLMLQEQQGPDAVLIDIEAERKKAFQAMAGPPKESVVKNFDRIREALDEAEREHNADVSAQRAELNQVSRERLLVLDELQLKGYRLFGHQMPEPPLRLDPEASKARVALAKRMALGGESLEGFDFTGADLAGLELDGVDLRRALFECASFAGAKLIGCNLDEAMMARAILDGGDFSRSSFNETNFGTSSFRGARFDGARFSKNNWLESRLEGASFRAARFDTETFVKTLFGEVDWTGALLTMSTIIDSDLRGANFAEIETDQLTFIQCDLTSVSFVKAKLERTSFIKCKGESVDFSESKQDRVALIEDSQFTASKWVRAKLRQVCLRGAELKDANFNSADAEGCDFSGATLAGANFYRVRAPKALFVRTSLKHADMKSTWLIGAVLQKARVHGADFRGSNLFRADLSKMQGDKYTNFADAYLVQVTRAGSLVEASAKEGSAQ